MYFGHSTGIVGQTERVEEVGNTDSARKGSICLVVIRGRQNICSALKKTVELNKYFLIQMILCIYTPLFWR